MSLINDALKRAKESHGEAPPPTTPPEKTGLRPVESAPRKGTPAWLWLLIIVVLVGLGMFFIGQSTHKTVAASSNNSTEAAPAEPKPVVVAQTPAPVAPKPAVVPETSAPPSPVQTPAVVAAAPPVGPASFKLQSIIYDPRRPSAMVSGKTLFVGDRIGGFHVVAIRKDSVTLVGGGQTNVLELEN